MVVLRLATSMYTPLPLGPRALVTAVAYRRHRGVELEYDGTAAAAGD